MKKKWIALLSTVLLFLLMMPETALATTGSLSPEDIYLTKSVTTDSKGNIVSAAYYNQNEMVVRQDEISAEDPNESYQEFYTYDETGKYPTECRIVYYDGTVEKLTFEYDENHQLTGINCWHPDGEPDWMERYTYDQSGQIIKTEFQSAEGAVYIKSTEYDDNGREIYSISTETLNGETDVREEMKSYQEIDDLSWNVTTTAYDGNNNLLADYTESRQYDDKGNLLTSVDYEEGELYRTVNTYDSSDRLVRSECTMESDPSMVPDIWTYTYRPDGLINDEVYRTIGDQYTTRYYYSLKPFDDVADTEYFAFPVKWAVDHGITSGISATGFGPYDSCTRAQAVTFLWRAAGQPEPAVSANPFQDVQASDYFYKAVLWAVENGITNGITSDTFGSGESCSRAQIVTFLYRFKGEPGLGGTVGFQDVHEGDYFYGPVLWAVADGVTNGTSETAFSPEAKCSRGQIVTFLYRAMTE